MRPSCPRMPTTDASACNRVMTHAPQPRRRHAIVRIMRTMAGMMRLSTGVDGLRIECKSPAERRGFMFASAGNRWRVEDALRFGFSGMRSHGGLSKRPAGRRSRRRPRRQP